ncbi:MAG: succinate dehydrogenase, cytochrome b556 subunit [Hydrotalea sp.]|nr:succinate dehydrogenase, cytochrome b556 subunit [Hydrotalea sp.]
MENSSSTNGEKSPSIPQHQRRKILSPGLGIYRWEITMVLSILHRFSGVFLWLVAVVALLLLSDRVLLHFFTAPDSFVAPLVGFIATIAKDFSYIILAPVFFALFFHGLNGIRHFFWDMGFGYNIKVARASAWLVIGLSLLATVIIAMTMWRLHS